jgi:uncharacterized protein involved in exopolysaccharide biosynthesis
MFNESFTVKAQWFLAGLVAGLLLGGGLMALWAIINAPPG